MMQKSSGGGLDSRMEVSADSFLEDYLKLLIGNHACRPLCFLVPRLP